MVDRISVKAAAIAAVSAKPLDEAGFRLSVALSLAVVVAVMARELVAVVVSTIVSTATVRLRLTRLTGCRPEESGA